jgi:uncharacterized membrane protein
MTPRRAIRWSFGLCACSFVLAATLNDRLPNPMPSHWGVDGTVDGYMAKPWGVYLYPCLVGLPALLGFILPRLSPKGFRIEPFARSFGLILAALTVFFAALMAVIFAQAMGASMPVERAAGAGVGLLLAVIGNILGKTRRNFFVGLKTPWTLASAEVWLRTHRLGGRLFVIGGLAVVAASLLGVGWIVTLVVVIAAAMIPIAYSFLVYRTTERRVRHE